MIILRRNKRKNIITLLNVLNLRKISYTLLEEVP